MGNAVATSMNLTNSSEPMGGEHQNVNFKIENPHDMMYYQVLKVWITLFIKYVLSFGNSYRIIMNNKNKFLLNWIECCLCPRYWNVFVLIGVHARVLKVLLNFKIYSKVKNSHHDPEHNSQSQNRMKKKKQPIRSQFCWQFNQLFMFSVNCLFNHIIRHEYLLK